MNVGNPFQGYSVLPYNGGLDSLGHWNGLPMVSALVCMVTHWTRPIVGHDIKLSGGHDFT